MSDDIVDRLREQAAWMETSWHDPSAYVINMQREAADEIVRLRTRVAELEAELVQSDSAWTFLDITKRRAADLEATLEELNDTYTIRRRAHNAEAALADQLAEALREVLAPDADWLGALAAYDRARTPATQEPT